MIHRDDDDENRADPVAPSSGRSHPGDGNEKNNGECDEDTQGGEQGTRKGKRTKDGNGKGKETGKETGKGYGTGNSFVKQTPGENDISRAVALQWQKERYEADSDTEG